MKKRTNFTRGLALALALMMLLFCFSACQSNSGGAAGPKDITLNVTHGDGSEKSFSISTDAEFLGEALQEEKLIEGEDGQYGLYITAVDGETADSDNQEWWCLKKDGEMTSTGVDTTPISDGDTFELVLTVGY